MPKPRVIASLVRQSPTYTRAHRVIAHSYMRFSDIEFDAAPRRTLDLRRSIGPWRAPTRHARIAPFSTNRAARFRGTERRPPERGDPAAPPFGPSAGNPTPGRQFGRPAWGTPCLPVPIALPLVRIFSTEQLASGPNRSLERYAYI